MGFVFGWESGEIGGFVVRRDSGSLTATEITDFGQLSLVSCPLSVGFGHLRFSGGIKHECCDYYDYIEWWLGE